MPRGQVWGPGWDTQGDRRGSGTGRREEACVVDAGWSLLIPFSTGGVEWPGWE